MEPPPTEPPPAGPILHPALTVDAVMRRWPETIQVMIRHGIFCAGCPIGIFHTVEEACALHQVDRPAFMADLLVAMREAKTR